MFRYLGCVWNPESAEQCFVARQIRQKLTVQPSEWRTVLSCPGLMVACSGERHGASEPYLLAAGAGVVVGTVFNRNSDPLALHLPRRAVFDSRETDTVLESKGRALVEKYWGRYVAFLRDAASGRRFILRDPIGGLPCMHATHRQVDLYFSSLSDITDLGIGGFGIDWAYLRARLAFGSGPADGTALQGVTEIYGGQCVEHDGDSVSKEFYWDPASIAASEQIDDVRYASRALQATLKSCVHAWASCYQNILHRLSGGLDSSIVLGCFSSAPSRPAVTGLTYYLPNGNSDQRPYARAAAHSANCRTIEKAREPEKMSYRHLLHMAPDARPIQGPYEFLELGEFEEQVAQVLGAEAISNGNSGDFIFGSYSRAEAPIAFVQRCGIGWPLVRICHDTARNTRHAFWGLLGRAVGEKLSPSSRDILTSGHLRARKLLSAELLASIEGQKACPHPWYRKIEEVPADTAMLVLWASLDRQFYNPRLSPDVPYPEPIDPISSQPVVELSLRIPCWVKNAEGLDRELARRAFRDDVPPEILMRRWKDRSAGAARTAYLANKAFTREILLDGILVREGLLDRTRLQQELCGENGLGVAKVGELIDYVFVETWLRSCHQVWRLAA